MGALIVGSGLKGTTGASRSFFKNERNILALQSLLLETGIAGPFQIQGEVQQKFDFLGHKIQELQKVSVSQIESHSYLLITKKPRDNIRQQTKVPEKKMELKRISIVFLVGTNSSK
jgi:hypothetical protein